MREDLIRLLHDGNYSCVVSKDGEIRTFTRRGVVDLFELYRSDPDFMRGAKVADKVIGKGAAAMLALGGVSEVWTDVISEPACELLEKCGVELSYFGIVPFRKRVQRYNFFGNAKTICLFFSTIFFYLPLTTRFSSPSVPFREQTRQCSRFFPLRSALP